LTAVSETGSVPVPAAAAPAKRPGSTLFGRGLLYVVVWALQLVASSVISPILAHLMAPAEFGALSSAIALYQLLSVAAVIGLDQALVLQRSEDGNSRRARGIITVALAVAFTVTAIATGTAPLWRGALGFQHDHLLVVLVILWTLPGAAVQVVLALLVAEDRLRTFSIISMISAIGGSVVGLVLITTVNNSATTYAWGGVVCQFIAMGIALAVGRPRLRGAFDREVVGRAVRLGLPLTLGNLAYFVLNAGDRIIVQRFLGPEEVARYQIAYVIGSAVIMLLTFTNSAWTPQFAALRDDVARWDLAMRSRDQLYRLLMPIVLAVTLVSPFALPILAPASYHTQQLTVVVFLVAITAFPVAASGATGRLLVVGRKGIAVGVIAAIAAAVNIVANLFLVPVMGIAGAALATFISYSVLAFLQLRSIPREPRWHGAPGIVLVGIGASLAVAAASMLLPQDTVWNLVRLAAAVACLPWFLNRLRAARDAPPEPPRRGRRAVRGGERPRRRASSNEYGPDQSRSTYRPIAPRVEPARRHARSTQQAPAGQPDPAEEHTDA
jgi:O-antigen/teichoic acid export membrane protein